MFLVYFFKYLFGNIIYIIYSKSRNDGVAMRNKNPVHQTKITVTLTETHTSKADDQKATLERFLQRERQLNKNLDEIEEIVDKVLKQTKDLLDQPWDDSSVDELSKRISDIKVISKYGCERSLTKQGDQLNLSQRTLLLLSVSIYKH